MLGENYEQYAENLEAAFSSSQLDFGIDSAKPQFDEYFPQDQKNIIEHLEKRLFPEEDISDFDLVVVVSDYSDQDAIVIYHALKYLSQSKDEAIILIDMIDKARGASADNNLRWNALKEDFLKQAQNKIITDIANGKNISEIVKQFPLSQLLIINATGIDSEKLSLIAKNLLLQSSSVDLDNLGAAVFQYATDLWLKEAEANGSLEYRLYPAGFSNYIKCKITLMVDLKKKILLL